MVGKNVVAGSEVGTVHDTSEDAEAVADDELLSGGELVDEGCLSLGVVGEEGVLDDSFLAGDDAAELRHEGEEEGIRYRRR